MSKKKTLFIGSFGAGNLGDEMILLAVLKKYPDAVVMTASAESSQKFIEQKIETVQPFPVGFGSWYKFIRSSLYRREIFCLRTKIDQIIFPGGGLFKNNTKAILLWFITVLWCRLLLPKVSIVFAGQGIDWPDQFWLQRLVFWSLSQADFIGVRDEVSARNLIKLGVRKKMLLQGDTVERWLNLEGSGEKGDRKTKDEKIIVETKYFSSYNNKQKILLNAAKSFDYQALIKKIEQKYSSSYEISLVVFAPSDLNCVPDDFVGEVLQPKTFRDLQQIFSDAPICIGQRFHFLIFGQKFGSTCFLLEQPYAPKTQILAEKYQIERFGK